MLRPELASTLVEVVDAFLPTDDGPGPRTTEVDMLLPLEITVEQGVGGLTFRAAPGHTRFVSGFLPPVHMARLRIVSLDDERQAAPRWAG